MVGQESRHKQKTGLFQARSPFEGRKGVCQADYQEITSLGSVETAVKSRFADVGLLAHVTPLSPIF